MRRRSILRWIVLTALSLTVVFMLSTIVHDETAAAANMLCRGMERPRSAIISQAAPGREHGLLSGSGQLFYSGKLLNKSLVTLLNHRHSRLLQHDFRNQNAVGIAFSAPGQLALFPIEPA